MWDLIVSVPDHCLSFYFSSMTTRDLHLVLLMVDLGLVAAKTNVMGIVACVLGMDQFGWGSLMVR